MEPDKSKKDWQAQWSRWRGSPALFVHVARVIKNSVDLALEDSNYQITFYVSGDVEAFETLEEFKESVTPEALRRFTLVIVRAEDPTLCINLEFRQASPAVGLKVDSKKHPDVADDARKEISVAIKRGASGWFQTVIFVLGAAAVGLVAYASINYLTKVPQVQSIFRNSVLRGAFSYVPGVLFTVLLLFARRRAEIAEIGQTRLWRMIRFIGPVVTGVAIAAITKLLFKSG